VHRAITDTIQKFLEGLNCIPRGRLNGRPLRLPVDSEQSIEPGTGLPVKPGRDSPVEPSEPDQRRAHLKPDSPPHPALQRSPMPRADPPPNPPAVGAGTPLAPLRHAARKGQVSPVAMAHDPVPGRRDGSPLPARVPPAPRRHHAPRLQQPASPRKRSGGSL